MYRKLCRAFLLGVFAWTGIAANQSWGAELTIGSVAPELSIEHWVQDGGGKFKPVTKFENGKVYVVEFWATWCGPCRMSMPHLAELQTKYSSKGVQIISISDEDLETVQKFLESKVPPPRGSKAEPKEGEAKTYAQLTSAYCLTTDPDGSSNKDYMEASSQNGIPAAFIVGKDQKIEWIGHPMSMDEPLAQIVEGKWDRNAFAEQFKDEQESQKVLMNLSLQMRKGNVKGALATLDAFVATCKNAEIKSSMLMIRVQILMQQKDMASQLPKAIEEALGDAKGSPSSVNNLAWMIYEASVNGLFEDKGTIVTVLKQAEISVEKADPTLKAAMLDTIAHLHHLNGDKKKALEVQKAAISIASDEQKAELKEFHDQLIEELK